MESLRFQQDLSILKVVQMELVIACLRIEYCIKVDAISGTIEGSMKHAGTLDTVPSGLRCDIYWFHTKHCSYWERSPWVTLRDTAEPLHFVSCLSGSRNSWDLQSFSFTAPRNP